MGVCVRVCVKLIISCQTDKLILSPSFHASIMHQAPWLETGEKKNETGVIFSTPE